MPPAIEKFIEEVKESNKKITEATAGLEQLRSKKESMQKHYEERSKDLSNEVNKNEKFMET